MPGYKDSILYSLWTRYKFVPLYLKVLPIILLLSAIFLLDQELIPTSVHPEVLHRLYYLPIILSGLLFGLKGGIFSATVVTLLFFPHWFDWFHSSISHRAHFDEVFLFYAFGILIGLLVDRERMETQQRQDQEQMACMGEAAAAVAHELKNPVITIGAYTQKILKKTDPEDPNRERLAVIYQECQRLELLLKDMIHFSRPISLEVNAVEVNFMVEEILKIVQPHAEQKQVSLCANLDAGLPALKADQNRIRQVLNNLILNAIQASDPGQPVLVRTQKQKGQIIIEILDQGCGIPQTSQDKIFQPFFSTKKEGTGLGLAISKRIIEMHQGRLVFRTNRPTGTVFSISLPLSKKSLLARAGAGGQKG
jgi:two-component system sensor histidine kinase HydH